MSQLKELQLELRQLLFPAKMPRQSKLFSGSVPHRLNVYRGTVHGNWEEALNSDFPLTKKQFSAKVWTQLSDLFFKTKPPHHWELNESVEPFVSFLAEQSVPAHVKELADYEYTDLQTFLSREEPRARMGVSNPTISTRVYQHDLLTWVKRGADPKKGPAKSPQVLVFYRTLNHQSLVLQADPLMLLALEHFSRRGAKLERLQDKRREILPQNRDSLIDLVENLKTRELLLI